MSDVAKEVKRHVEDAVDTAKDVARDAKKEVKRVAEDVVDAVEDKVEGVKEKASQVADTVEDKKEEVAHKVQDVVKKEDANAADVMEAIETSGDSLDAKAETLCRWAAGRAGVIVLTPLLGTVALMANEVYLINRLAKVYDKKLNERAVMSFLGAFGGTLAGNVLATLIPFGGFQIPIAVGVTYAVGKVAQAWIKADMPSDMEPFVDMFKEWTEKAKSEVKVLANDPLKNIPLGDETKNYLHDSGSRLSEAIDAMRHKMYYALEDGKENWQEAKEVLTERAAIGAEQIKNAASDMKGKVSSDRRSKDKTAQVATTAASLLTLIGDRLTDFAEEARKRLEENGHGEELDKLDKLIEDAKDMASEFKDKAMDTLEDVKDKAEDVIGDAKDKAADLKEKAEDAASKAKDKAEDVVEEAKDKAEQVKKDVEDKLQK